MDQASMCPMSPKGSLGSRIFLSRAASCAAATSPAGAALSVGGAVAAGVWPPAPFMISATPLSGRPIDLHICYSTHRCLACRRSFPADQSDLAPLKSQYTHRVQQTAVRLVIEDDMPYRMASWHLWRDHRVFVPWATIQNWVEAAGEKKPGRR